jgi:glycosyltransferase involved in cell wall biosynthesis
MRIALVAPPWLPVPPERYGGTEAVLDTLARGLQERGHEVVLIAHRDSTCPVPRTSVLPSTEGITMGSAVHEVRHVLGAYRMIELFQPDVVHDHTVVGPLYGSLHLGRSLPLVVTNHGPFNDDTTPPFAEIGARCAVVAISHSQAATAAERGVKVAAVIHHGVDTSRWPIGAGDGGYALFVGRMHPDKGVHRAIAIARDAGVPLRIAAKMREPAEREYFALEVQPHLGPGVEYVGEVGGTDKQDLMAGAMALINPIRWPEPFGMVMIEAMATGTPVLAYPWGAAPEIIADGVTGWLSADAAQMSGHLRDLAARGSDPVQRASCRAHVERHFSMDRMAGCHERLYRLLAAGTGTPSISRVMPSASPRTST